MSSPDGRLWIVYNGEIYNYRDLRCELESRGHRFHTETDTEVLLACYAEWGEACLERLNGMWSFAILDVERGRLFAARDRFGVKPFFYLLNDEAFVFASEEAAMLHTPFLKPSLNLGRAYDYLMWGTMASSSETFYEGVAELPAAHYLVFDCREPSLRLGRYYRLSVNEELGTFDATEFKRHVAAVRGLTVEAVRRRLRADVPVGSCLSGGIDSSSIVGSIAAITREHPIAEVGDFQRVYTACYDDPTVDESRYAQSVVERTRSTWNTTRPVAREFWSDLDALLRVQGEPFNGPNIYAQYRVMRRAAETGVKVMLDGQGGDEVFGGYEVFYYTLFLELLAHGRLRDLAGEWRGLANAPIGPSELVKGAVSTAGLAALPVRARNRAARSIYRRGRFLREDFTTAHRQRDEAMTPRGVISVNGLSRALMTGYTLPLLLRWEDRNSMAWSIEARTPFADDRELIEYVAGVPGAYKIHRGWSKVLLREAMRDVLPRLVADRTDKIGFATPERAWLLELAPQCRETLSLDDGCLYARALGDKLDELARCASPAVIREIWRAVIFLRWRHLAGL